MHTLLYLLGLYAVLGDEAPVDWVYTYTTVALLANPSFTGGVGPALLPPIDRL